MESQLESLMRETVSLREEVQRERDAVRVKEKQLEDHSHTIQRLKQAMADKEKEIEEGGREVKELKIRVHQEEATVMDMQVLTCTH